MVQTCNKKEIWDSILFSHNEIPSRGLVEEPAEISPDEIYEILDTQNRVYNAICMWEEKKE